MKVVFSYPVQYVGKEEQVGEPETIAEVPLPSRKAVIPDPRKRVSILYEEGHAPKVGDFVNIYAKGNVAVGSFRVDQIYWEVAEASDTSMLVWLVNP